MKDQKAKRGLRCAIYTRVSTDQGFEQDFNSLDAQREASEAYIKSQAHEGWRPHVSPHFHTILKASAKDALWRGSSSYRWMSGRRRCCGMLGMRS